MHAWLFNDAVLWRRLPITSSVIYGHEMVHGLLSYVSGLMALLHMLDALKDWSMQESV